MTFTDVQHIADAILYEGYILYPYRPTAIKNRQRWTFGVLYPPSFCAQQTGVDDWKMQTQCLVIGNACTAIEVRIRFLHLVDRTVGELTREDTGSAERWDSQTSPHFRPVASLQVGDQLYHSWQEAAERQVGINLLLEESISGRQRQVFSFPAQETTEILCDDHGDPVGRLVRAQQSINGSVEMVAEQCSSDTFRITVRIENLSPRASDSSQRRDHALLRSLVSTHAILCACDGEFVSLLEPPDRLRDPAESCQNIGVWPVLVGKPGSHHTMLASPIILYDYPQIASESPGDLFDGTEIDELLSLRIQTLTDEEKREMAAVDPRTRQILERTESLAHDEVLNLHGTLREKPLPNGHDDTTAVRTVRVDGVELGPGSQVRLRPRGRADAFDIVLRGKMATVQSIEEDYEKNVFVAVTVDDDPGQDFGRQGKTAHRFFFKSDEIEPIEHKA